MDTETPPEWRHGRHWLRKDHKHGQCISCGAPAACYIEEGWIDCADLCADCLTGLESTKDTL